MKNSKKKLLGTLLACIFVSLMINSVINATMISSLSEADEDIVLNEENPQQADDFDPPLTGYNDKFKWDFSNGTNLGFHYEWENETEFHAGYNYFNITSMPRIFFENPQLVSNYTYCVQLEEIYYNTTENKIKPVENGPLLNVSLVNVTETFFGMSTGFFFPMVPSGGGGGGPFPGWFFRSINPFIPTNDTTLALTWSAQRLKIWYQYMVEMGEFDLEIITPAANNNNIYFKNQTTGAYVNLTYYDNGILKYGEQYSYDDEDGWNTITLTTIFDVNPIDDLEWEFDVGDELYYGLNRNEILFNITKFENATVQNQGGRFVFQKVVANLSYWNGFSWQFATEAVIGSANENNPIAMVEGLPLVPLLIPEGVTISEVATQWSEYAFDFAEFNIVTSGENWVRLYNSSTKGYTKYTYNTSGFIELIDSHELFTYFTDDDYTVMYLKNSTEIDDTKIWKFKMETLGTDDFNVTLKIKVTADTELLYSAFNINPINISLGSGVLFIDIWVDNQLFLDPAHFSPINVTIDFNKAKYKNMKLYWFNLSFPDDTNVIWKTLPFTNYGNGTITFTVNHTSIFAFTNVISRVFGLPSADDDDDDDDEELGVVIIVVVVMLVCVGGVVVVITVLIKKGIIDISKLKGKR